MVENYFAFSLRPPQAYVPTYTPCMCLYTCKYAYTRTNTQTNGVSEENIQILRVYTIPMAWLITVTY